MNTAHQRVLVTGADGFIGKRLVARLNGDGMPAKAVGRSDVDLWDRAAVERLFADVQPVRVVHLAGSLDRRPVPEAVAAQWRDTFEAGRNVVLAAAQGGVKHLLVPGSIEEFGSVGGVLTPDLPAAAVTTYGLCKSLLREVSAYAARTGGLRLDWFRPFIVYGPGQTGPMMVPAAFEAGARARAADFSDGLQERDFVFVDDVVAWLSAGLRADVDASAGEVVVQHLGSARAITVRRVLDLIAAEFPSNQFNIGALPRRAHEPALQVAGPNPDGQPWAWAPSIGIEEGVRRTAEWWRDQVKG